MSHASSLAAAQNPARKLDVKRSHGPWKRTGERTIAGRYAIATDFVSRGRFSLLNYHTSLAHNASAGDRCALSPYAPLGSCERTAEHVFLGMCPYVGPSIRPSPRSRPNANSAVLRDTGAASLVHGVPGRIPQVMP